MTGTSDHVLYAAIVFLAIHLLPGTPLRALAVRAIGEGPYRGAFSLLSAAVLVWLALAYVDAPYEEIWPQAALTINFGIVKAETLSGPFSSSRECCVSISRSPPTPVPRITMEPSRHPCAAAFRRPPGLDRQRWLPQRESGQC